MGMGTIKFLTAGEVDKILSGTGKALSVRPRLGKLGAAARPGAGGDDRGV